MKSDCFTIDRNDRLCETFVELCGITKNEKMKIVRLLVIVYLITNHALVQAQIIISEVNFDVPRSEKYNFINPIDRSFYGEFIELYNYTDRDISLDGWSLADLTPEGFNFPANTIIKSRDFIVVAHKNNNTSENPITSFYPSSIGHETKIIYQDRIQLRNNRENIKLSTKKLGNINLKSSYEITNVTYKTKINVGSNYSSYPYYNIYNKYQTTLPINYANFPSINYKHEEGYTINPPNPFVLQFPPPLTPYNVTVSNILDDHYNDITYHDYVLALINNTCDKTVATIEQTPSLTLTTQKRCAVYDASGNITHWTTCNTTPPPPPVGYTEEEIQQIDAAITVFPNPTFGNITAQWDTQYLSKIIQINASSMSGINIYASPSLITTTSHAFNINTQPMGLYVVTFVLDTGQLISRNVIKY